MHVEIGPFDPLSATDADLAEQYEVITAVMALDDPDLSPQTLEAHIEMIRRPTSPMGPMRRWVARADGRIVAHASAIYPDQENRHLTIVRVIVTPAARRRGIGTALLRAIAPEVDVDGRTVVLGRGVNADAPGEFWARELGFVRTNTYVRQMLRISKVDPAVWQCPVPEGFRLERWIQAAPEALLGEYARARTAITDAPNGESALEFEDWTPERVRIDEAEMRSRGFRHRVVVAVEEAGGRVAAITELGMRAAQPTRAFQMDTAVVAEYRGRGLGLAVKGAMLGWLTAEHPAVEEIFTQTAHDNVHMIRINHAVGYTTTATLAELETATADLAKRLAPR